MNLKKVLRITYWLVGICLVLMVFGALIESITVALIGIAVSFAAVFVSIKYWRCPHCGKHLGRDLGKYCLHCGKELEDFRD